MKPIVGVLPLWDDEKESLWMLPGYFEGIQKAGGIPVMLPLTTDQEIIDQLVYSCDGFLFTGGHDVSPSLYGEKKRENVFCCEKRDIMEFVLLEKALKENKSVLGICRGIQFINVFFGGSLYQDIPSEFVSPINHHQTPPYEIGVHTNYIVKQTPLFALFDKESLHVNSYHHQAIKELAPDLKAMAFSEDGLVEAVYAPNYRFVWAVQWHPEFSYRIEDASLKIFQIFVNSMKRTECVYN